MYRKLREDYLFTLLLLLQTINMKSSVSEITQLKYLCIYTKLKLTNHANHHKIFHYTSNHDCSPHFQCWKPYFTNTACNKITIRDIIIHFPVSWKTIIRIHVRLYIIFLELLFRTKYIPFVVLPPLQHTLLIIVCTIILYNTRIFPYRKFSVDSEQNRYLGHILFQCETCSV